MSKPPLSNTGHVVIFASLYPPCEKAGSILVMHELLSHFDPTSFTVVTATRSGARRLSPEHGHRVFRIMHNTYLSGRGNVIWRLIQVPVSLGLATRLVRRLRPSVIVGVYPEFEFLYIAQKVAASLKIPWVAYLLDAVSHCDSRTAFGWIHRRIKAATFREASCVNVISEGMANYYKQTEGTQMRVLTHICPDLPVSTYLGTVENRAFMGGSIYSVNTHAAARIAKALSSLKAQLVITTSGTDSQLASAGLCGPHIVRTFYATMQDYQIALSQSAFLVLALDWPDETRIGKEAMETIFPTRTMEYLISGRPILVHCPEHYFLAQFFRAHGCGVVVSDRSGDGLCRACGQMLSDKAVITQVVERARMTAKEFSAEKVTRRFAETIAQVEKMQWGQKLPVAKE